MSFVGLTGSVVPDSKRWAILGLCVPMTGNGDALWVPSAAALNRVRSGSHRFWQRWAYCERMESLRLLRWQEGESSMGYSRRGLNRGATSNLLDFARREGECWHHYKMAVRKCTLQFYCALVAAVEA